jgi:hypothetical protein
VVKVNAKANAIRPHNREVVEGLLKGISLDEGLATLLRIFADIADLRAAGTDGYCFIGGTTDFSAIMLGVKIDGSKDAVYAPSILELGEAAKTLL